MSNGCENITVSAYEGLRSSPQNSNILRLTLSKQTGVIKEIKSNSYFVLGDIQFVALWTFTAVDLELAHF